ncbi:thermostable hemolysin [Sphingomonas sp. PL20]|uniref:thermostable hemolysin n=1 Tax=Sphingomonas sp. PL20 TaxID=2760712 RepID=UPI001AEB2BC0
MPEAAVTRLIATRYDAVHGAARVADYPEYLSVPGEAGPCATLGFRRASQSALFLERYLDAPIEQVLTTRFGRAIDRQDIVELGDHASVRAAATIALWHRAAHELADQAEFAVAVLTAPLRAMFKRLDLTIVELAPARAERLGCAADQWGRYYALDPVLCAGAIATGRERLALSDAKRGKHR